MSLTGIARTPLIIINGFFNYINKISQLAYVDSEKLELKNRIREMERELAELDEARIENDRLRILLGFRQKAKRFSIPALVVGRDPNNWSSVVFIDKGEKNGVVNDMVVISGHGLVGRIRESGTTMAKVMLINDIDSKIGAIEQKSREQGLLIGIPEGRCKLIYLPLDLDIRKGDRILTSGMGGIYPKGILIGRVAEVAKEKGRLYKYAIVEPSNKLSRLEEVLCIK